MKYTYLQIENMRQILCQFEFEQLSENDLLMVLMEGCRGWDNMQSDEIIEQFEGMYDEEERAELLK